MKCQQNLELDPKDAAWVYNDRGKNYSDKKENDLAFADFSKAIELNPKYALAYYNRCKMYNDKKEYDLAIADCTKSIELDPKYRAFL